jgi:hypothetical protein
MHWRQIAESLKQLIANIVSAQSAALGRGADRRAYMSATVLRDDKQDGAQTIPYSPDGSDERSTFSLHISC